MNNLIKLKLSNEDDLIKEYMYKEWKDHLLIMVCAEICINNEKEPLWYRAEIDIIQKSINRNPSLSIMTDDLNEFLTFLFKRNIVFYEELK